MSLTKLSFTLGLLLAVLLCTKGQDPKDPKLLQRLEAQVEAYELHAQTLAIRIAHLVHHPVPRNEDEVEENHVFELNQKHLEEIEKKIEKLKAEIVNIQTVTSTTIKPAPVRLPVQTTKSTKKPAKDD